MNQKVDTFQAARTISLGWKGRVLILFVALAALGVTVYPETLRDLFLSLIHRKDSSHGLFVPFLFGYFLWVKHEKTKLLKLYFSFLPGAAVVAIGFFVLFVSCGTAGILLNALSFMIVASGLVMALFGVRVFREVSFPLLFLIVMIPLPKTVYLHIAEWMREITASGSVGLMHFIQLPVFREGYNIHLPSTSLFIDTGCSGIRYLVSFFVFSLAYAFICKRTFKGKLLAVLSSFPLGIIAGVLRLSSIYLAVYFIGPFMAGHWPHIFLSWTVFLGVLVAAVAVDQSLSGWRERRA